MAERLYWAPPPALPSFPKGPKCSPSKQQLATQNSLDGLLYYLRAVSQARLPAKTTFISAMKSCSLIPTITEGKAIHARILKAGFGADRFIASSIICFYSSCGLLGSAHQVFDRIPDKDAALHTTMLMGCVKNGDIARARNLFDGMADRDVVAWNAMLSGYTRCGLPEDALELFQEMQISEIRPNEVTLITTLSACSLMGCLALGEWIHAYIDRNFGDSQNPTLDNSLVHMYAKCGRLDVALGLFLEKQDRNLELWNTMLTSFAIHGYGTSSLSVFSQMIKEGVLPDRISFLGILMACSHGGMVGHARSCFNCMTRVYGLDPKAEHYGCMVDVLSRGGHLVEAQMLIRSMPFEPDACAWGALLGGCFTYHNFELGMEAARHLLDLEPREESRYTALLNLFGMIGRVEDAMKLRKVMADMGIKPFPGRSTIQVDGVVHEFLAGDKSHCQSKEIYSMIEEISLNMESH